MPYADANEREYRNTGGEGPAAPADECAERDTEHEGEECIGDLDESRDVEVRRLDMTALCRVRPPPDQRCQRAHDRGSEQLRQLRS